MPRVKIIVAVQFARLILFALPQWLCSRNNLAIEIIAEPHPTLNRTKRLHQQKTSMSKPALDFHLELAVYWRRRLPE